ncbi:TerB family tellurite resistance protein [Gammaproteobacteria bacterium]|nr:TerB family tellurite resistance protein [Gammaproteobacteria bacterium]MDB3994943.1 TerB family tellurite resistance protein [Gammaproteobacteria bacterium]MDC0509014.1 TerB family tellurite resistance protein [Gammaproteobacteria bacterium]MDC0576946.1 TerB family tellurite resistance protein [Gammaproteobacteria bacterium]MDC3323535.1 TerB family tellurite resistance protein [Gammaproteobacteria bacterium]|tara:strand:- start:3109 stop:3561 length:453 start_codon:yes stop_codon:yes gene_type:complete
MINKIKNLISNLSKKEEEHKELDSSLLDNACAALLVEIAFADKDFDDTEKDSLRETLVKTYSLNEEEIEEIIQDADRSVEESTSLYGYTRIVNDEFNYEDKLDLIRNLWKVAYADGNLDKYEEHLLRKISDLIHVSHSDYINIKLEMRSD